MYKVVISDTERGKSGSLSLDTGRYSIGSNVESDIVLLGNEVCSKHAELILEDEDWQIVSIQGEVLSEPPATQYKVHNKDDEDNNELDTKDKSEENFLPGVKNIRVGEYLISIANKSVETPVVEKVDSQIPETDTEAIPENLNDNTKPEAAESLGDQILLTLKQSAGLSGAFVAAGTLLVVGTIWTFNSHAQADHIAVLSTTVTPKHASSIANNNSQEFAYIRKKVKTTKEKQRITKLLYKSGANFIDYEPSDDSSLVNIYNSNITKRALLIRTAKKLLPNKKVHIYNDTILKQSLSSFIATNFSDAEVEKVAMGNAHISISYNSRKDLKKIKMKIKKEIPSIKKVFVSIKEKKILEKNYIIKSIWLGYRPYIQIGEKVYHKNALLPGNETLVSIGHSYAMITDGNKTRKINYGEKND